MGQDERKKHKAFLCELGRHRNCAACRQRARCCQCWTECDFFGILGGFFLSLLLYSFLCTFSFTRKESGEVLTRAESGGDTNGIPAPERVPSASGEILRSDFFLYPLQLSLRYQCTHLAHLSCSFVPCVLCFPVSWFNLTTLSSFLMRIAQTKRQSGVEFIGWQKRRRASQLSLLEMAWHWPPGANAHECD